MDNVAPLGAPSSSFPNVLLVEDDQDNLDMYSLALRHDGLAVTQARNGAEALERAFAELPDMVVTDVVMPVLDGLALWRELRSDPRTRNTPVIAVTGRPIAGDEANRLRNDGCTALLYKPCDPLRLVHEIRTMLEHARELRSRSVDVPEPSQEPDSGRTIESLHVARIRGEFEEMPGLSLTLPQAARLLNLEPVVCERVLDYLSKSGFLALRQGRYVRA